MGSNHTIRAYNTSRQESSGKTPFFLLYRREAVLPQDAGFGATTNSYGETYYHKHPEDVAEMLNRARNFVLNKLHQIHLKQKARYNKTRRDVRYATGGLVLIYKPIRKVGKSEKLPHRWLGPYEVTRRISESNYEVERMGSRNSHSKVVHVVSLKPFYNPTRREPNTSGRHLTSLAVT